MAHGLFSFLKRTALVLLIVLAACSTPTQPTAQPSAYPTTTLWPSPTFFPTVTPLPTGDDLPVTGLENPFLSPFPTWTPGANSPLPIVQGTPGPTPAAQETPPGTPTASPEPIPTGKLTGGILGLIPTSQGLWAMRGNGANVTLLTTDPIDHIAASPGGTWAVYVTHDAPGTVYYQHPYGYRLKLITLFNDVTYNVTSLDPRGLSAGSLPEALDAAAQSLAAYDHGAMAWSRDGSTVAFTSSHEATSEKPAASDIYLYTPSSGWLRRLTTLDLPNGPAHAYDLQWSPDGRRLFFSAAYSFNANGSGAWAAGTWVASTDVGGEMVQLAQEGSSSGEKLHAWLPRTRALLSSTNPICGDSNLRSVGLRTGDVETLWPGCYADMIYDRTRAELLVSVTPNQSDPQNGTLPGLYRLRLYSAQPEQLVERGYEKLYSGDTYAAWYGFTRGEGLYALQRNGSVSDVFTGPPYDGSTGLLLTPLARIPYSRAWLWNGSDGTVYLASPGQPPQPAFHLDPQHMTPSPVIAGLYFFFAPSATGQRLYGVRTRDWQPFPVDDRIQNPTGIIWVP